MIPEKPTNSRDSIQYDGHSNTEPGRSTAASKASDEANLSSLRRQPRLVKFKPSPLKGRAIMQSMIQLGTTSRSVDCPGGGELTTPAPFNLATERVISKIQLADVAVDVDYSVDKKNLEILAESLRHAGQTSAILVAREKK